MNNGIFKKDARATITAIEKALKAGHKPLGMRVNPPERGAINVAAESLGVNRRTLLSRIAPSGACAKHGLSVNWSLYAAKPEESAIDPIERRRLKDLAAKAEARATDAERMAVTAASLREGVYRLAATPPLPPHWNAAPRNADGKHQEAIILNISDVHMGEVISLEQMGGRNSYNKAIAARRLERLFQSVVELGTEHWTGPPPSVIYVILLGDMISGEIHEELSKTNDLLAIPAVRDLSGHLIAGLNLLLANFECEIRVVSLPGNHGRVTRKPEAKAFAVDSYDTLVAWSVESWFAARGEKRLTFSAPISGDALININGWNFLFTHGDRIGSRGGAGFIGPAATAARGMQRVMSDIAAAEGIVVDYVIIGHFHTPLELEQGFVNGCLGGPSEYSRSGRMRSHAASQLMLTVHPVRGIARRWHIQVGRPEEGSIYKGRAV